MKQPEIYRIGDFYEYEIYLRYEGKWLRVNRILAKSAKDAIWKDQLAYPENTRIERVVGRPGTDYLLTGLDDSGRYWKPHVKPTPTRIGYNGIEEYINITEEKT